MRSTTEHIRCFSCGGQIRSQPGTARGVCQHCGADTPAVSGKGADEAVRISDLTNATLIRSPTLPCQNCGAEFSVDGGILSTLCPFCDTALVRADVHVHEHLPIRQLIPYSVDQTTAMAAVERFLDGAAGISRKRLASILSELELQPLFLSYYLFDADVELKVGLDDPTYGIFASAREIELTGWVEGYLVPGCETQGIFASIPSVDGTAWHLKDLIPYDPNAVAGALATFPAVPVHDAITRATDHLESIVSQRVRANLTETEAHGPLRYQRKDEWVRVVLVPVWLGQYFVNGHPYRIRVNGQTGEAGVEVPIPRDANFWQMVIYCVLIGFVGMFLILLGEDLGLWSHK